MGPKSTYVRYAAVCGLILLLVGLVASCSDDTPTGTAASQTGQGNVDPHGAGSFLLGFSPTDGMPGGRVEVWAYNLKISEDEHVVSFDVVLINRSEHTIFSPVWFYVTQIIPPEVVVLNSDIVYIRPGPAGFDYSEQLGDGKLDPGEASGPRNIEFGMRELTSFSIGWRITVGTPPNDAVVSGFVFQDMNRNGMRDPGEPGIPGAKVSLADAFEDDRVVGPEILRITETDERGRYGFQNVDAGLYEISGYGPDDWKSTSPNPMVVSLIEGSSGVIPLEGVNFGFAPPQPPGPEPVFGPLPVGPGAPHGEIFEGLFFIPSLEPTDEYALDVIIPPLLSQTGPLDRIDMAKVWINERMIYDFTCDSIPDVCFPATRVDIPKSLLMNGVNRVRIQVEGSERAFLIFTIVRWGYVRLQ